MKSIFLFSFLLIFNCGLSSQEEKASFALESDGIFLPISEDTSPSQLEKEFFSNMNLGLILKTNRKFYVGLSLGLLSEKGCKACDSEAIFKQKVNGFTTKGFARMNFLADKKFQIFLQGSLFFNQTKRKTKRTNEGEYMVQGHKGNGTVTEASIISGNDPLDDVVLSAFNQSNQRAKFLEYGFYIEPGLSYSISSKFSIQLVYSKLGYTFAKNGQGVYDQAFSKGLKAFDLDSQGRNSFYGWDNRLSTFRLGILCHL